MKKVKLYTEDGRYVITVLIPPFITAPKAITWGVRFFFYKDDDNYYEGFCVAAVMTEVDEKYLPKKEVEQVVSTESVGNDDLLFGVPKDLDEAVETFLDFFRNAKDMDNIIDMNEDKFRAYAHFGAGMFMRNSWYLWWHEGHKYDTWPKNKPGIVAFFNERGITHADDMSSIIITSAYRHLHKIPIDLEGQVKHYQDYWKENGFPEDGIHKVGK